MSRMIVGLCSGLLLAWAVACSSPAAEPRIPAPPASPAGPVLAVEPQSALVDVPLTIRVHGLAPGERITLRASSELYGSSWRAAAELVADSHGTVDTATQAPVAGSYAVADAMGLIWSMQPEQADWQKTFTTKLPLTPARIRFVAERAGTAFSTVEVTRLAVSTEVERFEIRPDEKDGLAGTMFVPHGNTPRPGVLVLGGSEGGLNERTAALLASHGYTTLALAYFDHENLPKTLYRLPLEYFGKAIELLAGHPRVDGNRLAVIGTSRGGELALLLGATFPAIKAVVGYVPSGVVWPGLDPTAPPDSGWTLGGKPVAFVPYKWDAALQAQWAAKMQAGEPIAVTAMFEAAMKDAKAMAAGEIPVEKIQGPVLMISGKADQVWPSTPLAEVAARRLQKHEHPHAVEHIAYEDAGHLIAPPYRPTTIAALTHPQTGVLLAFGGTAQGNARASADSWQRVLAFLDKALGKS